MTKQLERHPLDSRCKTIVHHRTVDRLTYASIATKLLEAEIGVPPYYRDAREQEDEAAWDLLVRSYARSAKTVFERACAMGYAKPLPEGTAFRSHHTGHATPHYDSRLTERLDQLKGEYEGLQAGGATEQAELVEMRIKTEKHRLYRLRKAARDRVRYGRPFMNGAEAAAVLPPIVYYDGAERVSKPYPMITDLELLGTKEYDELIDERVAEVNANPHATARDRELAANPHVLPLSQEQAEKLGGPTSNNPWSREGASPGDILTFRHYGEQVAPAVVLYGTLAWDIKPGRRPLGEPSTPDLGEKVLELVANGSLQHCPPEFSEFVRESDRTPLLDYLNTRVLYLRRKYGLNEPASELNRQKLQHLLKVTGGIPGCLKPDPAQCEKWRNNPGDETLAEREAFVQEAARKFIEEVWPTIAKHYDDRPNFRI